MNCQVDKIAYQFMAPMISKPNDFHFQISLNRLRTFELMLTTKAVCTSPMPCSEPWGIEHLSRSCSTLLTCCRYTHLVLVALHCSRTSVGTLREQLPGHFFTCTCRLVAIAGSGGFGPLRG